MLISLRPLPEDAAAVAGMLRRIEAKRGLRPGYLAPYECPECGSPAYSENERDTCRCQAGVVKS